MLSTSFSRYIREVRRPVDKKRTKFIQNRNRELEYSQIQTVNLHFNPIRKIN